ncbi:MAG: hypothetical protein IKY76_03340 [Alistipes sp.]|nr:hypothetical protein [Alistipes sp.]
MKKAMMILCAALAALGFWGCYQDVINYTNYNTAIYIQTTTNGAYTRAQDVDTYAFNADTTEWTVASWEDAQARIITHKTSGKKRNDPDAFGSFNFSDEYQSSILLESPLSMIVMVCPEHQIYAYRNYELPENLEKVDTKFYITTWRQSHNSAGWRVVNEFYTPPQQ